MLYEVITITGKGEAPFARHTLHGTEHFHAPERQGVLRQAVTEWFGQSDFTAVVSGFQPAHPRHGGGGWVKVAEFDADVAFVGVDFDSDGVADHILMA